MEIQAQDEFVQMKRKEMKGDFRQKIRGLKHTAGEIRKFRKERGKDRPEHLREKKEKSRKEHQKKDSDGHKERKEHGEHKEKKIRWHEEKD